MSNILTFVVLIVVSVISINAELRGDICRRKCPQDCGCIVDDKNEATCQCSSENHPLIRPPRPPPIRCRIPRCRRPCFLQNDVTKICPYCKCPNTGRPAIQCAPPLCEAPCYLHYYPGYVCPGCKCP